MKKIYTLFLFIIISATAWAQCQLQYSTTPCTCNGVCDGTATANPIGGTPPYTFMWSPSGQTTQTATGLCAGGYMCQVMDALGNGCFSTSNASVTQPAAISINISGTNNSSCSNCNGTLTAAVGGGTSPYMYSWTSTPSQSTATATGLCGGIYYVYVTDANGCTALSVGTVGSTTPTITVVTTGNSSGSCNPCNGMVAASASGGLFV